MSDVRLTVGDIECDVEVLRLAEGDTLILKFPQTATRAHVDYVREAVKGIFQHNEVLALMGLDIAVVRPEPDA